MLKLVCMQVSSTGHAVRSTDNAVDAADLLKGASVLLTDLRLGHQDCTEVVEYARAHSIPVIVMTSDTEAARERFGRNVDVLAKPFSAQQLAMILGAV